MIDEHSLRETRKFTVKRSKLTSVSKIATNSLNFTTESHGNLDPISIRIKQAYPQCHTKDSHIMKNVYLNKCEDCGTEFTKVYCPKCGLEARHTF